MIYDCFLFFNELDLLELRLSELETAVDRFVLCEATRTFQGVNKDLFFDAHKHRFSRWSNRITHLVYYVPEVQCSAWDRESAQRNYLKHGIIDAGPDDLIMLSDVDEIPCPDDLHGILAPGMFQADMSYYFLNCRAVNYPWYHPCIFRKADMPRNWDRTRRWRKPIVGRSWHFSFLGGVDAIREKLLSFSHTEYSTEFWTNPKRIAQAISSRQDLFDRRFRYEIVPIDHTFPKTIRDNPERWKDYIA